MEEHVFRDHQKDQYKRKKEQWGVVPDNGRRGQIQSISGGNGFRQEEIHLCDKIGKNERDNEYRYK